MESHQAQLGCGARGAESLRRFAARTRVFFLSEYGTTAHSGFLDTLDVQGLDAEILQVQNLGWSGIDVVLRRWAIKEFWFHTGHLDVDVLEDLTGSDAENAIGGLDQVVAFATAMLASEMIGEAESGIKLLGFDEKTGAVRLPFHWFHGALSDHYVFVLTDGTRLTCVFRDRTAANFV